MGKTVRSKTPETEAQRQRNRMDDILRRQSQLNVLRPSKNRLLTTVTGKHPATSR